MHVLLAMPVGLVVWLAACYGSTALHTVQQGQATHGFMGQETEASAGLARSVWGGDWRQR